MSQNNFKPAAISVQQKWQLIADYIKMLRQLEALPSYEDLFMDAHYVIVELLALVCDSKQAEPEGRQVFGQALALMRDCPAKMLVTQALL